jgi:L-alanine-DL-glutamate epimerase-like enolase superfamily enzyme
VRSEVPIRDVRAAAYRVPTATPESDGTLDWNATTLVVVHAAAGSVTGLGYTYADVATARLVHDTLREVVVGRDALAVGASFDAMVHAIRNLGRPGVASMAIAAVDNALWDVKARVLDLPLCTLLGCVRDTVPVYGSGGFTSYDDAALGEQLGGWVADGMRQVKMKVGRDAAADAARVHIARTAIGDAGLFVDANGGYARKQALGLAERFAEDGVTWFEEPVSSDDLAGLRVLRDRAPPGMEVTAGEYGYDLGYFRAMLEAGAVDVLQADATRCAGVTGFMRVAALCDAFHVPLSSHCAPALHVHLCCAATPVRHLEYFFDHVRLEAMVFDGPPSPQDGSLAPDRTRPGLGLELRSADVRRFAA